MAKLKKVKIHNAVRHTGLKTVLDRIEGIAGPRHEPVLGAVQLAKSRPLEKLVVSVSKIRRTREEARRKGLAMAEEDRVRRKPRSIGELRKKGRVIIPNVTIPIEELVMRGRKADPKQTAKAKVAALALKKAEAEKNQIKKKANKRKFPAPTAGFAFDNRFRVVGGGLPGTGKKR